MLVYNTNQAVCDVANGYRRQAFLKHPVFCYLAAAQYCLGHFITATSGIIVPADFDPADRAVCFKVCLPWE